MAVVFLEQGSPEGLSTMSGILGGNLDCNGAESPESASNMVNLWILSYDARRAGDNERRSGSRYANSTCHLSRLTAQHSTPHAWNTKY